MRILSIVTLVSPLGEYGGPVRVAVNQATELRRLGHEVLLSGAARGYSNGPPAEIEGTRAALFPARTLLPGIGFAGLAAPGLQRRLARLTRDVDVVHIHAARDLVTLPAADWVRRKGIPYVLQTHGMITPTEKILARPLDTWLTRRVLRDAQSVFYLTEREKGELTEIGGPGLRLEQLGNGVPVAPVYPTNPGAEVLYLARLAERKRPIEFVEMAKRLAPEFPNVRFRLVGPDEGQATRVSEAIEDSGIDIKWEGAISPDSAVERLSRATIYVLPSVHEPYPMSVLEAMSLGVPVVITNSCGLASLVDSEGCGIVVDDSLTSLTAAVTSLLRHPDRAREMGAAGARVTRHRLGMTAVGQQLERAYSR